MLDSNRIKFVIMKTIRYIMGFFLFFTLTSCNDWFEVSPETQVSSDDLYEKGNGFRMQVNGLYKSLGSSSLYAQELTWGFLDVLGQYYVRQNLDNTYQQVNDRQYENVNVLPTGFGQECTRLLPIAIILSNTWIKPPTVFSSLVNPNG